MSHETYQYIYKPSEDITIRKDQSSTFEFENSSDGKNLKYRLFFTGQTALFYYWKTEADAEMLYSSIEDALDSKQAYKCQYCLNFTNNKPVTYRKTAFKKITWPIVLSYLGLIGNTDDWTAGIRVKSDGLKIEGGGFVRIRFEVRYSRDGISHKSTAFDPDEIKEIEIPAGTYDWTEFSIPITLPKSKMANLCCFVEGEGYTGKLLFENPYVTSSNGYNVLPQFEKYAPDRTERAWIGCNLSRKEWPEFEISLNGKVFFSGEMFERCHVYSECETDIPTKLMRDGKNILEIKLISDYPDSLPYVIHEVGYFVEKADEFNIISCPEHISEHSTAHILIQTNKSDVRVGFETSCSKLFAESVEFDEPGLHVFNIKCTEAVNDAEFCLFSNSHRENATIRRVVPKTDDGVLIGSGDLVYINQESRSDFTEYIKWYVSSNVGNMMTLRPCYRWCGGRVLNEENWRYLTNILNELGMKYAHIVDGRELPGAIGNPTPEMLVGEGFLGRQSHEYDTHSLSSGKSKEITSSPALIANLDFWMRIQKEYPETAEPRHRAENYLTVGERVFLFNSPNESITDMKSASERFVNLMAALRNGHTRHSGIGSVFKYFAMAGFDWLSAELLYGPTEAIIAFLRGTAECYNQKSIGAHLAIQWSTHPHNTPARYRILRTALYVCYMQGINEINTEEGFWHIEQYYSAFDRKSDACLSHLKQQNDLYRYISSHSRQGHFYTNFAFISGRYDGFQNNANKTIWGIDSFNICDAERSWALMHLFYPRNIIDGFIWRMQCPENESIGMFSGTPYGNCNAVPIEQNAKQLSKYKVLSFAGYNAATYEDIDKLTAYVNGGGKLIIGWPHLSETLNRCDVENYRHKYIETAFTKMLTEDVSDFVGDFLNGFKIHVNKSATVGDGGVLVKTDSGLPLLIKHSVGKGEIYFVNAAEYPAANQSLMNVYTDIFRSLAEFINSKEHTWIKCKDDVQFAVYDRDDGLRDIYVTAVDWYKDPEKVRSAVLTLGTKQYELSLNFGSMIKIVSDGAVGAWVDSEDGEVISVNEESICIHGYGRLLVHWIKSGKLVSKMVDFSEKAVLEIKI